MKTRTALYAFFIGFYLLTGTAFSQTSGCYEKVRSDGIRLLQNGQYGEALNQFWVARDCDDRPNQNDLDTWIKRTQDSWVNALKGNVDAAQKAEREARQAREVAENAQKKEADARLLAENNRQKALEQGKLAESRRLALLADMARQRGQRSDAVLLAYLALQLSDEKLQDPIFQSFAAAVKDSFSRVLFTTAAPVDQMVVAGGADQSTLGVHAGTDFYLVAMDNPASNPQSMGDYQILASWNDGKDTRIALRSKTGETAYLWNKTNGVMVPLQGHTDKITHAAFSPNGHRLVTCSRDNTARIWDATGAFIKAITGHKGNLYQTVFSPDGEYLLTRSSDGTAGLWTRDGQAIATLGGEEAYFYDACFAPQGSVILTASAKGAQLWDFQGNSILAFGQETGPLKSASFLSNGDKILGYSADKSVRIWGKDGVLWKELTPAGESSGVATAHHGQEILTWGQANQLKIWNQEGVLLQTVSGQSGTLMDARFSPDDHQLHTTSREGTSRLWSENGQSLIEWQLETDNPVPGVFSTAPAGIITTAQNNRNIWFCPMPQLVYQQLKEDHSSLIPELSRLQAIYKIQFFEELMR